MTMPHGGAKDFGGSIRVLMGVRNARVATVDVLSTRPAEASQVFVGRTPQETSEMVGLLYSLCSCAQTVTSLHALENAQAMTPAPPHAAARTLLRLAEMLSQTAMRLCMDWPRLLGVAQETVIVRECLGAERALESALFAGASWRTPGGIAFTPDVLAVQNKITTLMKLIDMTVMHDGLADQLRRSMTLSSLEGFGALSDPAKREDGALVRRWQGEGVSRACDAFGLSLAARLEARLADMVALPQEMAEVAGILASGEACAQPARLSGRGEAHVETARGKLSHAVTLENGRIAAYAIDAPTDMNFAPDGPVRAGLLGADATDAGALLRAAELHVLAIDPCVACTVEVRHA